MSSAAEALAANQSSRRNITIEITNLTSNVCLMNPKVHLESGVIHSPPQPTVRPTMTGVCNFDKPAVKAEGAVGVLTYDIYERHMNGARDMLAIMFSVPLDYNLYKNWFSLGIYPKDREGGEKLFKELYYDKPETAFVRQKSNGSDLTFEGPSLDVKATMSPLGRSIMKVEVWDKVFTPGMHQRY